MRMFLGEILNLIVWVAFFFLGVYICIIALDVLGLIHDVVVWE